MITALTSPSLTFEESGAGSLRMEERFTKARIARSGTLMRISFSTEAIPGRISQGRDTMLPFTKLFGIIHPRTVIAHKKLLFCNRKKDDSESNHVVLFGTDGPSMPKIA